MKPDRIELVRQDLWTLISAASGSSDRISAGPVYGPTVIRALCMLMNGNYSLLHDALRRRNRTPVSASYEKPRIVR